MKLMKLARSHQSHGRFGWAATSLVIVACFGAAWLFSWATFGVRTGWGNIYEDSLRPSVVDVVEYEEVRVTERNFYSRSRKVNLKWKEKWIVDVDPDLLRRQVMDGTWDLTWRRWALERGGGVLEFNVFLDVGESGGDTFVVTFWAGRLREIGERYNRGAECGVAEGAEAEVGYGLSWQFSGDAFDRIRDLYGPHAWTGCRILVLYEGATAWAPHARDATVSVPRGGMIPLMGMLLARSVEGLGGSMDQDAGDAVARRLVDEITVGLDYARLESVVDRVAYAFGPVQFLTLSTTYASMLLLLASLRLGWARGATGIAMNLIPYIGFFGTLLGMGTALAVLGEANLRLSSNECG